MYFSVKAVFLFGIRLAWFKHTRNEKKGDLLCLQLTVKVSLRRISYLNKNNIYKTFRAVVYDKRYYLIRCNYIGI